MKKILPLIFLIFCLVLNTAAIAEEPAPYNPGDITNQLKLQALSQGLMLSHTFNAALDMDDTAFGEEHAADIDAVEPQTALAAPCHLCVYGLRDDHCRACAQPRHPRPAIP